MVRQRLATKRRSPRKLDATNRQEILRLLKLNGELSVLQLCNLRKLTHTAIRRQLSALQQEGLVAYRIEETGIGRPVHMFHLTESSTSCFPSDYAGVATNLIDTVLASTGHRGVLDFLHAANDHLIQKLQSDLKDLSFEQRIEGLCAYFRNSGYMSEWQRLPDGNYFLYHQNCAIYNLASKYRQFCLLELHLIQTVLGVRITRQQYIFKDQPICGYVVHVAGEAEKTD